MNMKAAASLTGSLLARKGAAYPASYSAPAASPDSTGDASDAVAPRAYNDPRVIASAPPPVVAPATHATQDQQGEQLQDGRFAPGPATGETRAVKTPIDTTRPVNNTPVVEITPAVENKHKPAIGTAAAAPPRRAPVANFATAATDGIGLPQTIDKMGRVRLSVRLDPDRYLRVKMASARTRWSAQDIVIAALDRYLGGQSGPGSDDSSDDTGGNHGNLN
jgi:hypothetical protein